MKIQIVMNCSLPVPPVMGGAVEKIWHNLARELGRRHEVVVYSVSHERLPDRETHGRLRHVRLPGFSWNNHRVANVLNSFRWSLRLLRRLEPGDVLVINEIAAPEILPRIQPRAGAVCVQVQRMPKLHHRWLYGSAARLHCPSTAVLEEMKRVAPARVARCKVIHNPTDVDVFSPRVGAQQKNGRCEILYVGRVHPEKGIDVALRALARCRGRGKMFLRIVGPSSEQSGGDAAFAANLKRQAGELGLTRDEWTLDPPVFDDTHLAAVYRQADIFAYPSRAARGETFGVSVLEAMAAGLPCVVSGLACFRDLVSHGRNGLVVEQPEPSAWAKALDTLVEDAALRGAMAVRSRELALNFSYRKIAARFEDDFEFLLKKRT